VHKKKKKKPHGIKRIVQEVGKGRTGTGAVKE
jgi:hypothetical protein